MARIILRILLVAVLVVNLIILVLSYLSGVNIYKKYGKFILSVAGILCLMIIAFYIALGLLGIG